MTDTEGEHSHLAKRYRKIEMPQMYCVFLSIYKLLHKENVGTHLVFLVDVMLACMRNKNSQWDTLHKQLHRSGIHPIMFTKIVAQEEKCQSGPFSSFQRFHTIPRIGEMDQYA